MDERVTEAVALAAEAGISIIEVPRIDLDRIAGGALHQGVALQVPPYAYAHPDELRNRLTAAGVIVEDSPDGPTWSLKDV